MGGSGNPIRLVVQSLPGRPTASYRIILYPSRAGLRTPLIVSSRQELIRRLRRAIPDFDERSLTTESGVTQIVFAATVTMTDAQLEALLAV